MVRNQPPQTSSSLLTDFLPGPVGQITRDVLAQRVRARRGPMTGSARYPKLSFRGAQSAIPESITTDRGYGFRACAKWRIPE